MEPRATHGHAHHGSHAGTTHGGVPVRNVAQSVIRGPYVVFTIERADNLAGGRGGKRAFIDQRLDLSKY